MLPLLRHLALIVSHQDLSLAMFPVVPHSTVGRTALEIKLLRTAVPLEEVWPVPILRDWDHHRVLLSFRNYHHVFLNGESFLVLFAKPTIAFLFLFFVLRAVYNRSDDV